LLFFPGRGFIQTNLLSITAPGTSKTFQPSRAVSVSNVYFHDRMNFPSSVVGKMASPV
jgi:hypothetical protein